MPYALHRNQVRSRQLARLAGIVVTGVGLLALLGWALDIETFKSVWPGLATMKANTAICLIAIGAALWLLHERAGRRAALVGKGCAALAALIAFLTLVQYATGYDFGIDLLFFRDAALATKHTLNPGRMAVSTALSIWLLGSGLLLLDFGAQRQLTPSQAAATLAALISGIALASYAYGYSALQSVAPFASMALNTAALVMAAALGILLVRPNQGMMVLATGPTLGGALIRRQLLIAIVAMFGFGWLRLLGVRLGLFDTTFSVAMSVTYHFGLVLFIVGWTGWHMHRIELDRQQAETEASLAVESANMGTWDYDPVAGTLVWSKRCKEIFGIAENAPVTFELFSSRVHPDDRDHLQAAIFQSTDPHGSGEQDIEYRVCWPDGTVRWVVAKGQAFFAGDRAKRHAVRIVGAVVDITERKLAEERAQRYLAELTHLGRISIAGEMASGLAHELNQPLTAISVQAGLALMLAKKGDPQGKAELHTALDDIARQSLRAGGIINFLKEFIRKGTQQRSLVYVNDVIADVVPLLEPQLRQHHIRLSQNLAELPPIEAERVQIGQLVLNLLQNAVDSLQEVPIEHRFLEITTALDHARAIVVSVRDSGKGITPENMGQLFNSFFTTKPDGMGMGLAICRSIAEAHGATLQAVANPEGGATFVFRLPLPERVPTTTAPRQAAPQAIERATP